MPRQFKVSAFITLILAVLFYLFFQISKHNLALSQVNAFAEDPYDVVGSIGRFALVASVFMSLEDSAVVLGYSLLAKPLGLFRQDSNDKMSRRAYQRN